MRRFVLILLLFCGSFLSTIAQTPPAGTVKIEKVEVKFIDVSDDPAGNVGTECTANPADHHIAANITIPITGQTNTIRYNIEAFNKGQAWNSVDGLSGDRKAGPIAIRWYCSYYQANPDNQVAYEMVSCLTEYEADGKPRSFLNMTQVETPLFNSYGDLLTFRVNFPDVNRRVKLYFTFRIQKRKAYTLNTTDLASFMSGADPLTLHYYVGHNLGVSLQRKGVQVWGNAFLLAKFLPSSMFDLVPMNAQNVPYTSIPTNISDEGGKKRRAWFITGDVVSWQPTPEYLEVKYTPNPDYTLELYTVSGEKIEESSTATYRLPKGTRFHFRARTTDACKKIETFKVTRTDGSQDFPAISALDKDNRVYYGTKDLYTLEKDVTEVRPQITDKKYTVNYVTPNSGCNISITKKDGGGAVSSGMELPCKTKILISITPPATGETIQSVTLNREGYPARGLVKNAAGYWVFSTSDGAFTLESNIAGISIVLNPATHTLTYNPTSACGTFTVKDNMGTPRASGTTFSADYLKLEATVTPPKQFSKFTVTYAGGTQEIRTTNPAEVDFNRNITAIDLECEESVSLAVTGTNYVVTLVSGKYKKNGTFVEEPGHVFPYASTPYTLLNNAVVKIAVPDAYIIKPLTKFVVTWFDGTKREETLTQNPSHRSFNITLTQSVTKIELKDEPFFSITYPEGANKPKLKLKDKRAFRADGTEITTASDPNLIVSSGSQIQANGKVELLVAGVQPSPGKLIQKYVVVMGGTDHDYLPSATLWDLVVTADITDIKVVEIDDPAVAGPFKLKWQDVPAVYTIAVDYVGATPPVVSEGAPIPKNTVITITLTLADPDAGVVESLTAKLANGSSQVLTPTVSGNVYTYTYTITSNTELLVVAHNRTRYTITYDETPTGYTIFVGSSKENSSIVHTGTQVFDGTKLYIKAEKNTPDADEYTFDGIQVNGVLIPSTDKDGDFYVYTVSANVTSIVAVYTPKPKFPVVYNETPTGYTLFVGKSKESASVVPSGTMVLGGTKLYIKAERNPADAEGYRLTGIEVNGVSVTTREGAYYVYEVNAAVNSIVAVYQQKPQYTVTYIGIQSNCTIEVKKKKDNSTVPTGTSLYEDTPLLIAITLNNPAEHIKKVKLTYGSSTNPPVLITPDSDGNYSFILTNNVVSIEVESGLIAKYTITYNNSGDVRYTVLLDKDNIHSDLASGTQVDSEMKIWVRVLSTRDPNLLPKEVYVRRRNPNYLTPSDPEYVVESIKANKSVGAEGATYYSYIVRSDVELLAIYEPAPLPSLRFRYENGGTDYSLDVRSDSPTNTTPVVAGHWYEYQPGTLIYINLTISSSLPNHRVARILINDVPVSLEKENGWYVLQLTGDVYSVVFELVEVSANMSMLVYADPVNAHLEVYNTGVLMPSGTVLPQGTQLFAVVSDNALGGLFSVLTVNGMIKGHLLTYDVATSKEGMAFEMATDPVTEVVAYVAQPLPEDNSTRYHITVEKPEHGTLRLEKIGGTTMQIRPGETKEAKVGDQFEVITSSEDLKRYEFAGSSIANYTRQLDGTNKLIFTVPTLTTGETHIRVVVVYAPVRPSFVVNWSLTSGGTLSVVNMSENDQEVHAGEKVFAGDYVKYTLTAAAGYRIRNCYVNGRSVLSGNETSYEATLRVDTDILLDATFELDPTNPPTGIEEGKVFHGASVRPNPFGAELLIVVENNLANAVYELISAQGAVVRRGALFDITSVDTHDVPSGLYLLRLIAPNGQAHTLRVIKN